MSTIVQGLAYTGTSPFTLMLAIAFFSWGIWCGLQMIEGGSQAVFWNAIFWLAQVPLLQTPILGYSAFCGAQIRIFGRLSPVDFGFYGSMLGAQFGLNLGQPEGRVAVGVNLFAAGVAFWLIEMCEYSEPASMSGEIPDVVNR